MREGDGDDMCTTQSLTEAQQFDRIVAFAANSCTLRPGDPVAYKFAYLHDDGPARESLVIDYEVEECGRVSHNVRVALGHLTVVSDGSDGGSAPKSTARSGPRMPRAMSTRGGPQAEQNAVAIEHGQSWPLMGELGSQIVPVAPEPGQAVVLRTLLADDDPAPNPDDSFGDLTIARPFEDGRRARFPCLPRTATNTSRSTSH